MSADGPEQREADRLERALHRLDEIQCAEQLADESRDNPPLTESEFTTAGRVDERHSSFADSIFEFAKANNDMYRAAFDSGFNAGYAAALVKAVTK